MAAKKVAGKTSGADLKRAFALIDKDDDKGLKALLATGLSPDASFDPSAKYGAQSALCFALNRDKLARLRNGELEIMGGAPAKKARKAKKP